MGKQSIIEEASEQEEFREGYPQVTLPEVVIEEVDPQDNLPDDLEKQQTKKAHEEFVQEAAPQLEISQEAQAPKEEASTHDSHSESGTKVRDQGKRRKLLCCILAPIAVLVMMAVSALIAYAIIMRPGKVNLDDKMSALTQSLLADPDFMFSDKINSDVKGYDKKIKLDLTSTVLLPDRPAEYAAGSYYSEFQYTLPQDYVTEGNPQIQSYTAWYDQNNIKALQFVFTNGVTQLRTPIFGSATQGNFEKKTINMASPVISVQSMMINKFQPTGVQQTWALVNFGLNGDNATRVGPQDAAMPKEEARRDNLDNSVLPSQRIIGIHGMVQSSLGVLRSLSFKLANQVHVMTREEYYAKIDTDFAKKTAELDADRSLMSPLSMMDQLSLYGLTMQGYYGDNTTKKPMALDIEKSLLWKAWMDKKGISQRSAKILFLQAVDGLW